MGEFVVQLQPGCWLAPRRDDPCGRTLVAAHARVYKSEGAATRALNKAKACRPWPNAVIKECACYETTHVSGDRLELRLAALGLIGYAGAVSRVRHGKAEPALVIKARQIGMPTPIKDWGSELTQAGIPTADQARVFAIARTMMTALLERDINAEPRS